MNKKGPSWLVLCLIGLAAGLLLSMTNRLTKDQIIKQVHMPEQISGYEYEFLECRKMLEKGEKESCSMPLSDTVSVMELMDELRAQWGLVYPGDEGYRD